MYCINCGTLCRDDMKFCPSCGKRLSGSLSTTVSVKKSPSSLPQCKDKEEGYFYHSHKNTLKGLQEYCTKYPQGFYISEAKSRMNDIQRAKQKDIKILSKILKTICLIIAIPVVLCQAISTGGKVFYFQRLIDWYKKD